MKDVRKMYRLKWSNGKYHEDFCECCVDKPWKEDYIDSSFEIKTGTCHLCDYERDESVIILEKAEKVENEIKAVKDLVQQINSSKRSIEIDDLILRRTEEYNDLVKGLNNPREIRKSLQFPVELDKSILMIVLDNHLEKLRKRKNKLMQKAAKSSV